MIRFKPHCALLSVSGVLLLAGCALRDPWAGAPEFEISYFSPRSESAPVGTFLGDGNFLMGWNILGPVAPGGNGGLHAELLPEENVLCGSRNAPQDARWHRLLARNEGPDAVPGQVDFSRLFLEKPSAKAPSVFYACLTLQCDSEYGGLVLNAGSCGKLKVWINGHPVYSYENGNRPLKPDTDKVEGIILRKGYNRIVVKYMDNEGDYRNSRKFCLRFTDAAGQPARVR
ncbi:MAG: hypothetical protein BWY31_03054 [Lentisphaerae bacterium ADurb.Bin242]|nr:MAG: hypothetical protein BWY31_03054 [Lentisphaerae bacterium ADurb.Bin242]